MSKEEKNQNLLDGSQNLQTEVTKFWSSKSGAKLKSRLISIPEWLTVR